MVRKVGGFTFQELNLTIDDIRQIGEAGAPTCPMNFVIARLITTPWPRATPSSCG